MVLIDLGGIRNLVWILYKNKVCRTFSHYCLFSYKNLCFWSVVSLFHFASLFQLVFTCCLIVSICFLIILLHWFISFHCFVFFQWFCFTVSLCLTIVWLISHFLLFIVYWFVLWIFACLIVCQDKHLIVLKVYFVQDCVHLLLPINQWKEVCYSKYINIIYFGVMWHSQSACLEIMINEVWSMLNTILFQWLWMHAFITFPLI